MKSKAARGKGEQHAGREELSAAGQDGRSCKTQGLAAGREALSTAGRRGRSCEQLEGGSCEQQPGTGGTANTRQWEELPTACWRYARGAFNSKEAGGANSGGPQTCEHTRDRRIKQQQCWTEDGRTAFSSAGREALHFASA